MLKELTFLISAENHPDLRARTVMLLHRLHIPVLGLAMRRAREAPRMRIALEVLADPERVAAQLAKIVHVVSIEMHQQEERPVRKRREAQVQER